MLSVINALERGSAEPGVIDKSLKKIDDWRTLFRSGATARLEALLMKAMDNMVTECSTQGPTQRIATLARVRIILNCFEGQGVFQLAQKVDNMMTDASLTERSAAWSAAVDKHDFKALHAAIISYKGQKLSKEQLDDVFQQVVSAQQAIATAMTNAENQPRDVLTQISPATDLLELIFNQLFDALKPHSALTSSKLEAHLQGARILAHTGLRLSLAVRQVAELSKEEQEKAGIGEAWHPVQELLDASSAYVAAKGEYGEVQLPTDLKMHRETVLHCVAAIDARARRVVAELAAPITFGLCKELNDALANFKLVNRGSTDGKPWFHSVPDDAHLDDVLDTASKTLLKSPAGKIKTCESNVEGLSVRLSIVSRSLSHVDHEMEHLLDSVATALNETKAIKLEVKLVKTFQKYPQISKQKSSIDSFKNEFRPFGKLKPHVQPKLWAEFASVAQLDSADQVVEQ